MKNDKKEIITYDEYNDSLDSTGYVELIGLMEKRIKMPRKEIDKIIDNHFNLAYSINKNYKSFLTSIENYMANNKISKLTTSTVNKISFYQPTLF